mmetsp:Transcript_62552/g.149097  ORF Transcript_62552/g.149097 Transcript_62552/m.149097 type:complete len:226 (-) Transcript_62552:320-997(-)
MFHRKSSMFAGGRDGGPPFFGTGAGGTAGGAGVVGGTSGPAFGGGSAGADFAAVGTANFFGSESFQESLSFCSSTFAGHFRRKLRASVSPASFTLKGTFHSSLNSVSRSASGRAPWLFLARFCSTLTTPCMSIRPSIAVSCSFLGFFSALPSAPSAGRLPSATAGSAAAGAAGAAAVVAGAAGGAAAGTAFDAGVAFEVPIAAAFAAFREANSFRYLLSSSMSPA